MMIEACIHFAAVKARPQFGLTVFVALVLCLGGGAARAQSGSPACGINPLSSLYRILDHPLSFPRFFETKGINLAACCANRSRSLQKWIPSCGLYCDHPIE